VNSGFDAGRMDGLMFAEEQLDLIFNKHPIIMNAAKNRLFSEAVKILIQMRQSRTDSPQHRKRCVDVLNSTKICVLLDKKSKIKLRFFAAASLISTNILIRSLSTRSNILRKNYDTHV
jgi:hypothetical protein